MDRETLLNILKTLEAFPPKTAALEATLRIGVGYGGAWYTSQKEHMVLWLEGYETAGAYGRKPNSGADAKAIYNRLMCPASLFWMAEAGGVSDALLDAAHRAATDASDHCASQSAAIRRVIPWAVLEARLTQLSEGGATRCNGHTDLADTPSA